ncbi:MAG: peptide deformylase [Bacteroidota bacterium]
MKRKLILYFLIFVSVYALAQCKKQVEDNTPPASEDILAFSDSEKSIIYNNGIDSAFRILNYFILPDSLILRNQSRNINWNDTASLFYLTDRMLVSVTQAGGVGIAAPQVGLNRNIIWVWRNDKPTHPWELYFNPVITKYSDSTKLRSDGCLSLPGVSGQSWRAIWVNVEYDLANGTHKSEHISQAYTAHIFQHEIDHLNGIVYVDRMTQ